MTTYSLAFLWGLLILASFLGWGVLVNRAALGGTQVDWGLRAGWGLAFTVCTGAVLNLLDAISTPLLVAWVAGGALVLATTLVLGRATLAVRADAILDTVRRDRLLAVAAALLAGLVFVQYAGSVRGQPFNGFTASLPYFNEHDDFQAYFVFPREMLDTGSLTRDPYNERRITSSLGGESYLDALVISVLPEQSLHLLEPGLGMLLVEGLLLGLLARLRAPPRLAVAVCALPLLVAVPIGNISSVAIAFALFLTLVRTLVLSQELPTLLAIGLVSLTTASLVATKSSVVPTTVIFLALWYARGSRTPLRIRVLQGTGVLLVTTVLLAPWMVSLHRSSGTFLFPILGQGDHGTRYGTFYSPFDLLTPRHVGHVLFSTATSVPVVAVVLLLAASWLLLLGADDLLRVSRTLGVAALVGTFAVALLIGFDVDRFSYAFVMAALTMLATTLVIPGRGCRGSYAHRIGVVALAAGLVVGASWDETKPMYRGLLKGASTAVRSEPLVSANERASYRAMQRSVPEGAPLLARLEKPFLLDFKRNRVFVVDWPGGASPPPGLPLDDGPEALAGYLRQHGVRYVAYSYAKEGGFPRSAFGSRLRLEPNSFGRVAAENAFAFQDLLRRLGGTRRRVYDDRGNFVLDLTTRVRG